MASILNLNEDYPIIIEYEFRNIIQRSGSRNIQYIAKWNNPISKYRLNRSLLTIAELSQIIQFFDNLEGNTNPFIYIDPCDNQATITEIDTGLELSTKGTAYLFDSSSDYKFQLTKVYRIGNKAHVRSLTRIINDGSFQLATAQPYTIDYDSGVITFASDPGFTEVNWSGTFGVLCRLETDTLNSLQTLLECDDLVEENHDLTGFDFIEIKENSWLVVRENLIGNLEHKFALQDDVERVSKRTFSTRIESLDSGFEQRFQRWTGASKDYETGERNINYDEEIIYIIGLWRITKGGAIGFKYGTQNQWSHFTESLSIEVEPGHFKINPLKVIEKTNNTLFDDTTYVVPLINGTFFSNTIAFNSAISALRERLKNDLWNGDEATTQKYFNDQNAINTGDNWVNRLAVDPRDIVAQQNNEPKKLVNILWSGTGYPGYHTDGNTPVAEPSFDYLADYNLLATDFDSFDSNRTIFYVVDNSPEFSYFVDHVNNALNGTNGYPLGVKNYGVELKLGFDNTITDEIFVTDLIGKQDQYFIDSFLPICNCFLITRSDGVKLGFTDHDENVTIGTDTFFPIVGGNLESISKSIEPNVNTTKTTHLFNSNSITIEDILARKYDNAKYDIIVTNWHDTTKRKVIFSGFFGKNIISYQNGVAVSCQTEIRSIFSKLKQKNTLITVKLCPLKLGKTGDNECNVDLSGLGLIDHLSITSVESNTLFTTDSTRTTNSYYGNITFTSGANNGIAVISSFYDGSTKKIKLFENPPFNITVGDTLNAEIRCDRTWDTCHTTFDNAINHQGFPNLPGNDQLQKTNRE